MFGCGDDRDSKRTIGIRDKQILYRNAKGRCQNPACRKKIDFDEMQVGHKTAWSKQGRTTLANSICLCYRCNKLQGTDSWATFLKKQGVEDPKAKKMRSVKQSLEALSVSQLKSLAKKHHLEVKGEIVEDWSTSYRKAPTKSQYIKKLAGKVTKAELTVLGKSKVRTDSVVGLDKVETYLTKQGYDISSKRHGFDFVGVDDSRFGSDRYIVVGFNHERTVSSDHVLKFKKKARAYYENMCEQYVGTPRIDALVVYTGALSKDAPLVVKASKPKIKFKKF